ncbi:hypothetical protein F5Y00DRAFT_268386 [Daldinia vernicosa]|uniref:uncharacterized protein n=1 Tax=Daldinia vernicosa TaxID=114800 RepID=UPI0020072902|nr:uncharacterized protein F5Y00DRAFT_268386 [Daldinia vernicosa]KAI0850648.1 hypothetical protein F5Y00DRAFT_268386 [Daldinia vernicosa]
MDETTLVPTILLTTLVLLLAIVIAVPYMIDFFIIITTPASLFWGLPSYRPQGPPLPPPPTESTIRSTPLNPTMTDLSARSLK